MRCIEVDTWKLSLELLMETTDPAQIDTLVQERFPVYGDTISCQICYSYLKSRDASFKAMTCHANTLNDDLLSAVKELLDEKIVSAGKTMLLASLIKGKNDIHYTVECFMKFNVLLNSYSLFYRRYWNTSGHKSGLELVFVIVYLK